MTGTWNTPDPAQADVNTYRGFGNSPMNETDPSGLAPPTRGSYPRERLGPISGYFADLATDYPLSSPLTGTLSGVSTLFDGTIFFAIKDASAQAHAKALNDAATTNDPVRKAAAYMATVYITVGEGFAQNGAMVAAGPPVAATSKLPILGTVLSNPYVQTGASTIATGLSAKNVVDRAKEGNLTVSDAMLLHYSLAGTRQSLLPDLPTSTLRVPATVRTAGANAQAKWLAENVPGITEEQAMTLLQNAYKRESTVVIGGSRVRGNFRSDSDLDVGYGSLSKSQAQKLKSQASQIGPLRIDRTPIVPGFESSSVPKIYTPEEFFQRWGARGPGDPNAGLLYTPSGSITLYPDGAIMTLPPGVEP